MTEAVTTTTYAEYAATPTRDGGENFGAVHRVYKSPPTREERMALRAGGWRPVDLTTGHYAHTDVLRSALAISASGRGLVYTR